MPLYCFITRAGGIDAMTERAVDCADLDAAKAHARRTLAGIAFDRLLQDGGDVAIEVVIEDHAGQHVSTLAFDATLRITDAEEAADAAR
jgi:hypothetical protein